MEDPTPITSVFVKGLSAEVTKEKIHDAFSQFGEIRNELQGISMRTSRGDRDPIAFVTFVQPESVPGAVAGPVYIDDQQASQPLSLHVGCATQLLALGSHISLCADLPHPDHSPPSVLLQEASLWVRLRPGGRGLVTIHSGDLSRARTRGFAVQQEMIP